MINKFKYLDSFYWQLCFFKRQFANEYSGHWCFLDGKIKTILETFWQLLNLLVPTWFQFLSDKLILIGADSNLELLFNNIEKTNNELRDAIIKMQVKQDFLQNKKNQMSILIFIKWIIEY